MAEKIFVLAVFARSIVLIAIAVYAARRGRRLRPVAPDAQALPAGEHFFPASQNDPDSVGTLPYSGQQMDVEPNRG
jgi:hypothetical protein